MLDRLYLWIGVLVIALGVFWAGKSTLEDRAVLQDRLDATERAQAGRREILKADIKADAERRKVGLSVARKVQAVREKEKQVEVPSSASDAELDRMFLDAVREGNAGIESTR